MGQCNAQTNACPSGVVPRRVDQSTAQEPITTKKEPLLQPATRGLELISSCAKFYANGVVVAKPAIQLSPVAALNQPAMRQMCPSKVSKPSISTVAVLCSFFLVLPILALAAIMWWGATSGAAGGPEVVADDARVILTQTANPVFPPPRNRKTVAVAVSTAQSDIIIHKVKTLAIDGGASGWTGSR